MNIGMLWFDNDPKVEIEVKIERASRYYRDKYGKSPNLCYVHPTMVTTKSVEAAQPELRAGGITIRTSRSVLPNHFWIGVNGTSTFSES